MNVMGKGVAKKCWFYAVAKGRKVGVFPTWDECKEQVSGFNNARYKKFPTKAEALKFIEEHQQENSSAPKVSVSAASSSLQTTKRQFSTFNKPFSLDDDEAPSSKKPKLHVDDEGFVHCYTDGACESNGKIGAKSGVGVWWNHGHPFNIAEPTQGSKATNNVAEIQAAIRAVETAKSNGIDKLVINTDSQFLINCMTQWIDGFKRRDWKTAKGSPVINKEDLETLDKAINDNKVIVKWNHVRGHKGIEGNEMADALARSGASKFK